MDNFSLEKEQIDKVRSEAVVKYQAHFKVIDNKQNVLCALSAIAGITLATKYITPHAGFRLSIGGCFYMATRIAMEEYE